MIVSIAAAWAACHLIATYLPRSERRVLAVGLALGVGAILGLTAFVGTVLHIADAII